MTLELATLFRSIPRPPVGSTDMFGVASIPSFDGHRLGKDSHGAPALLVRVSDRSATTPAPLALEHLSVQHDLRCVVAREDGHSQEEVVTVIRCTSSDRALREYFIGVLGVQVQFLGREPTRVQVASAVRRLTELFRPLTEPAKKTVQGLWAEVFLIRNSSDPIALLRSWHNEVEEAYDFSAGAFRVEVKSTSGPTRTHRFSLRQLRPGNGINVIIASVFAERSAGGMSLATLVSELWTAPLHLESLVRDNHDGVEPVLL